MPNHLTHEPTVAEAMTAAPDDALMSSEQVSELMKVSRVTLSRWRSLEKGPPFIRLSACSVAYPVGAYRQWVQAQTCETVPR